VDSHLKHLKYFERHCQQLAEAMNSGNFKLSKKIKIARYDISEELQSLGLTASRAAAVGDWRHNAPI
jgi:hypothetical protein